jgi:hypothetical protein
MVEYRPFKPFVLGSSPSALILYTKIISGGVVQRLEFQASNLEVGVRFPPPLPEKHVIVIGV